MCFAILIAPLIGSWSPVDILSIFKRCCPLTSYITCGGHPLQAVIWYCERIYFPSQSLLLCKVLQINVFCHFDCTFDRIMISCGYIVHFRRCCPLTFYITCWGHPLQVVSWCCERRYFPSQGSLLCKVLQISVLPF